MGGNVIALWSLRNHELSQLSTEYEVSVGVIRQFERRTIEVEASDNGETFRLGYCFRPPTLWSSRRSTPLLVFLHGSGQRGNDNVQQLLGAATAMCAAKLADRYPCAMLVPQCPKHLNWSAPVSNNRDMLDMVLTMLDEVLKDTRIDPNRVYLCGYSMGGFGAWKLAAQSSRRFAAVVPIAGGSDPDLAGKLLNIPIWAVHSEDDDVVSVEETRKIVEAIRDAGGAPKYLEFKDAGHGAWREVFKVASPVLK